MTAVKTNIRIEDIRPRDHEALKTFSSWKSRAWVCAVSQKHGRILRSFLKPKIDYSESNSAGSRGVNKEYILEYDVLYEISEPVSWKRTDRRFCYFDESGEHRVKDEDVLTWAKEV